ncbi:hypothetical protein BGZ61DRAFT_494085 [Ilyonectria robusta]|uniref:uncharacterized protein n=1 Tax=Ilyonectria robusta TaxID=1079257 RepID=UPI001E8E3D23|nr:uncharacterized protein BGZ61DRAFT_494085 [Ilyonectria robusta]KAH8694608.1 hypothetical protein BGZ61DRAFT_494085 [Ilyonectria robusta]
MPSSLKRAVRIGGSSGAVTDRHHALERIAKNENVDVIHGDWMSEYNMSKRGADKHLAKLSAAPTGAFEPTFIESLRPALKHLAAKKIKFACNAGASDPALLAAFVRGMIKDQGLELKVAWVEGDEVSLDMLKEQQKIGNGLEALTTDKPLADWDFEPIYAQCYLGAFGIAAAWSAGADIVLCGRVADAAPVMAAGIWWHGWTREQFDQLAGAFVCGHLIECRNYVCGANWTGFKRFGAKVLDFGFPIAEIAEDGSFVVTKEDNTDGCVTIETCKSQLLYEIQGPWYFNSDVTAELRDIKFEQVGTDRVKVTGVKGLPPPPTTKVSITATGGYQAEAHYFAVDSATCDIRIFAQAKNVEDLSYEKFLRPIIDNIMAAYPGAQFACDTRQGEPKHAVQHRVHMESGEIIEIPSPTVTKIFPRHQPSYNTDSPVDLASFGPTTLAPLGYIVHARSGDKASNSNCGFYVRHEDEYDWLRSILSIDKVKELLGDDYNGKLVERFELPGIWAVHFLLFDHLDRGVASSSTYDVLGKNVAEYLRCKRVEIPKRFLERGRI